MEVDRYWSAGLHSWASAVFLGVRYLALLGHVPLLYHVYIPCEEEVGQNLPPSGLYLILFSASTCQSLPPDSPLCLLTVTEYGFSPRTTAYWCHF